MMSETIDSMETVDRIVSDVIDNGDVSGLQILVIVLCTLFNMLDGFDITAMAIVAGTVSQELELSADRLGLVFSFALAGMMLGAMFLAPVSDLIGRRNTIILSLTTVGISILFTANASSLVEFVGLRFISGLGAGAMLACQAALVAEYSPEKYRSLSVTVATAGYPLGAALTAVVAGGIMPEYGWRGIFWFGGTITLMFGVLAWVMLPESLKYLFERRPVDTLNRVNKILARLKRSGLDELPSVKRHVVGQSDSIVINMLRLLAPQHRATTLSLWAVFFLCFATLYFLMSWIPKLMEQTGYSDEVGRMAFLLFNIGGVVGVLILGMMSTRWRLTNLVFAFLAASAICMLVVAVSSNELSLLLTMVCIIGFLLQGGFVGLYAVAAKVYPTEIRSTGIGWAVGLGRAGAVVGPAAAGYLIAAGFSMSTNFLIFAVPMAAGGVLSYWLKVK